MWYVIHAEREHISKWQMELPVEVGCIQSKLYIYIYICVCIPSNDVRKRFECGIKRHWRRGGCTTSFSFDIYSEQNLADFCKKAVFTVLIDDWNSMWRTWESSRSEKHGIYEYVSEMFPLWFTIVIETVLIIARLDFWFGISRGDVHFG